MSTSFPFRLAMAWSVGVLVLLLLIVRSCAPSVPALGVEVSADTTRVVDAGRAPTVRDTAAVSGSGGSVPSVRIEYRDRWREVVRWRDVATDTCPELDSLAGEAGVRIVYVPRAADIEGVIAPRPVYVSAGRVVLTYQRVDSLNAGQTVQDVYRVPRERLRLWADVGVGVDVPGPVHPQFAGNLRHPFLELRTGLDVRPGIVPGVVAIEGAARLRSQIEQPFVVEPTAWLRWRPLDLRH